MEKFNIPDLLAAIEAQVLWFDLINTAENASLKNHHHKILGIIMIINK